MKTFDYTLRSKTITYDKFSRIEGIVMVIDVRDSTTGETTSMGVRTDSFTEGVKLLKKKLGDRAFGFISENRGEQ